MVFTLHRYIFREVFKVFILAAVALTLMMSLGSILRPVQEYGVGPKQVTHLMLYFLPVTLTFCLPMAALFAASLVYGRLANDNELDACRASGISLLSLIYPGLALAIIVAIANLILSFYVMPAFIRLAEKSIKDDAKQILFRNIQRRGYYELPPDGRWKIYADLADIKNNVLAGVVTIYSKGSKVSKIITAQTAKIVFSRVSAPGGFNEVRITAYKAHQMGSDDRAGFSAEYLSLTHEFGSLLGDNIKFKNIREMKQIAADPMQFYPIAHIARQTAARFTAELLAQDITSAIKDSSAGFYQLYNKRRFIRLAADNCSVSEPPATGVRLFGNVLVTQTDIQSNDGEPRHVSRLRCSNCFLDIDSDQLAPTLTIDIRNAREEKTQKLVARRIIRGLILPESVRKRFKYENVLLDITPELTKAALRKGPSAELVNLQNTLARKIHNTFAAIDAELHSRLVFGIGCITLIMFGIALGIILKGGHLLTAFAASVIPAVLLIVCIMMGRNIAKNPGTEAVWGIRLMWAGLVLLSAVALALYRKLLKK